MRWRDGSKRRVLLASMPFSLAHFPNLALGLLKPAVEAAGMACDVRYFSLEHTALLGADAHAAISDVRSYKAQVGEWVFAGAAAGTPDAPDTAYLTDVFQAEFPELYQPHRILTFLAARAGAGEFVEACYRSVDWDAYDVVGFTSSFQQSMASLALARRIRVDHPDIFIVIGGANCQDEMGAETTPTKARARARVTGRFRSCCGVWLRVRACRASTAWWCGRTAGPSFRRARPIRWPSSTPCRCRISTRSSTSTPHSAFRSAIRRRWCSRRRAAAGGAPSSIAPFAG